MNKQLETISPQRLHHLSADGKKIKLIDVRTAAEYRAGHVAGAKLIPLDEFNADSLTEIEIHSGVDYDEPVYLTCHAGQRAEQAAQRLIDAGYQNVSLLEGGTQAWQKAGLPMSRCGSAISLERQVQITIGVLLVLKVIFGFTVHELFFAAIPFIGAGLIFAGLSNWCGLSRLIAVLPWNQNRNCSEQARA
jgi:rhodanese-related sulfurtransferase